VATEFLLIAATLVELKCRRLLPDDDGVDLDEELALWEERDLLLARLLECKTFKDASRVMSDLIAAAGRSMPRRAGLEDQFLDLAPDPLEGMTPDRLRSAFLRVVTAKPKPELSLAHVTEIKANVTDAIGELLDHLPQAGRTSFRALTRHLIERVEIVVRFLALLELFKQGLIELDQAACFGELTVEWVGTLGADRDLALSSVDSYEG
jgi:segregation and condensation protein A